MPASKNTARTEHARSLLTEATDHLAKAREALDASPPRYQDALADVLAAPCAALRALVAWYGTPDGTDAPCAHGDDLHALAGRAANLNNVVRTPAHRAVQLAERAPAIARASHLSVADREDIETGWYTARNVVRTVSAELHATGA